MAWLPSIEPFRDCLGRVFFWTQKCDSDVARKGCGGFLSRVCAKPGGRSPPHFSMLKPIKNPFLVPKILARPQPHLRGSISPSGRFTLGSLPKSPPNAVHKESQPDEEKMRELSREDFFYNPFGGKKCPLLLSMSGNAPRDENAIGSSSPVISRKRGKRGSRGISAKSADSIKYWVGQLERKYGRKRLSFLTLTVPDFQGSLREQLQEAWAEIVHRFVDELKRILRRSGAATDAVFGCTEIQIKRSERDGWNVPHLHLVFVGRATVRGHWFVSPASIRRLWKRMVGNQLPIDSYDFGASENLQQVRRSAARYLGKYLSKQSSKSRTPTDSGEWHPTEYIVCGRKFRREFKSLTYGGSDIAEYLLECFRRHTVLSGWYAYPICIESSIGKQVVGWVGHCDEFIVNAREHVWENCG